MPERHITARVTVTDPEACAARAWAATDAIDAAGGRVLARGERPAELEGPGRPRNTAIGVYSLDHTLVCRRPHDHPAARRLRDSAAVIDLYAAQGVE
ncbi:DUF1330 domain-containing protein [Phenylobacterium sp. SCN 70-31]|uniref:DUF1330 domain-containing protein n=1 Tax=Phenylobacterium sp. SCN 70-31 TaxID=1660129 RepID=UPI000868923D|nr:DUF1330 domain-containing protein [Phenylobacterium sp. SCN 70-31]ODT88371.1 MAG: hypothetical protein ABS78_07065 [Phenylobacterium sp. SCN 70-31]